MSVYVPFLILKPLQKALALLGLRYTALRAWGLGFRLSRSPRVFLRTVNANLTAGPPTGFRVLGFRD